MACSSLCDFIFYRFAVVRMRVSFVSPLTTVCERGGLFAVFRRSDAVVSFLRMRVAGPKASGQRVRTSENRAEAWAEGFRRRIAYFAELLLTLNGPNDSA